MRALFNSNRLLNFAYFTSKISKLREVCLSLEERFLEANISVLLCALDSTPRNNNYLKNRGQFKSVDPAM